MPNIVFNIDFMGQIKQVEYNGEITCEEFMLDITKKYFNNPSTDSSKYVFKVGAKLLNYQRFKYKKLKELIKDNSIVRLIRKKNICHCLPEIIINDNGKEIKAIFDSDFDRETTCEEFMFNFTKKYTDYATTNPDKYLFELMDGKILNSPEYMYEKLYDLNEKLNLYNINFVRK